MQCNKKIKNKSYWFPTSWICNKPIWKDGLCKKHYTKSELKKLKWCERDNYREPTQNEFETCSLKLKKENTNNIYHLKNGIIKKQLKNGSYVETILEPLKENFVIKVI